MKKLLSLFICICLTVCTMTAPAFAEDSVVPERVSGLLNAIGVTRNEDSVNAEATISRGQFVVYASRLAGEMFAGKTEKYYVDVPEGSFCYEAVSALANRGALSVPEDKVFNPNNPITYSEVCKILMCVLNFKDYAEAKGGYPAGYEYMARQTDLNMGLDGIEMNFKNVMQMLYNACHIKLLDVKSVENSYVNWTAGEETILSLSRDIYYIEGRVDKTDVVSLTDDTPLKNGLVEICGVSVSADNTGIERALGHYVEAYYVKSSDNMPGNVFYYYDKSETTIIDIEDFDGYNQGVLSYADEKADKIKTLNIGTNVPVLLNGIEVRNDIPSAFNDTNYGHIEITYYNNEIVLVHIKRSETMVVKYTNETHKIAWDEYRSGKHFVFDQNEWDNINVYAKESGTKVSFEHLQKGQVLTIYRSANGKIAEVYITDKSFTGTIEQIEDDEIKINGVFYKINKELETYIELNTGIYATFYLDAYDAVCVMEPITSESMYAYIYDVSGDYSVFDQARKLKVFTLNSEHKILDVVLPVTVDGERKETADELLRALEATGDMGTYRQLVGIRFNSKGEIKNIDTAASSVEEAEERGTLVSQIKYTGNEVQFYNSSGQAAFFPEPAMFRDTKVMVVPEESDDLPSENKFRITDRSYFNRTMTYKISSYKIDTTHKFSDIIIVRKEETGVLYPSDMPIMVDEVYEKLDENGEPVKVIKGIKQGQHYEAECSDNIVFYSITKSDSTNPLHTTETHIDSIDDLRRGDLIRTATGVDDRVSLIQVVHDFENHAKPYWFGAGSIADRPGELRSVNNIFTLTYGYVIDKWVDKNRDWDNVSDKPPVLIDIGYSDEQNVDRMMVLSNDVLTIYDVANDRIYQGKSTDITTFNSGYGGSEIIAASVYFETKGIYVYVYPEGR